MSDPVVSSAEFGQEVVPQGPSEGQLRSGSVATALMLLLLAGLTLLGALTGEPLAVTLGVLVLLVILLARLWSRLALFDLRYHATVSRDRLMPGEDFELTMIIENRKILPLPWLRLMDYVPFGIDVEGPTSSFSAVPGSLQLEARIRLGAFERVRLPRRLTAARRGLYHFGPARMVASDLFGFYEATGAVPRGSREVVVYPRIVPISSFPLTPARPMGDDRSRRSLIVDPLRPAGIREYRVGDRLRDIDWKATAKHGEPFVRTYESSVTGHVVILLECALRAAALEDSVTAAASLATHLFDRGYGLGLVTNDSAAGEAGPRIVPPARGPHQLAEVLRALAAVRSGAAPPLEQVIKSRGGEALPFGCSIVYVTGQVHADSLEFLKSFRAIGCTLTVAYAGRTEPPDTADVGLVDLRSVPGLLATDREGED